MAQLVYEAVTQSGTRGLFTAGTLVWPFQHNGRYSMLDSRKWQDLNKDEKVRFCAKQGWTYVTPPA